MWARGRRRRRELYEYERVVVLTGAGVSVASGLPTYRGDDGRWRDPEVEEQHHVDRLPESASALWRVWGPVRTQLGTTEPNAGHVAIASFQRAVADAGGSCHVVTTNVDGLHQRAGTRGVAELHGSVLRTRCSDRQCAVTPFADVTAHDVPPGCPQCGRPLVPDVVLYGEPVDLDAQWATKQALRECGLFIAVGTSGMVSPASGYVRYASDVGARTLLVNTTEPQPPSRFFEETHLGRAEELLPQLLGTSA